MPGHGLSISMITVSSTFFFLFLFCSISMISIITDQSGDPAVELHAAVHDGGRGQPHLVWWWGEDSSSLRR